MLQLQYLSGHFSVLELNDLCDSRMVTARAHRIASHGLAQKVLPHQRITKARKYENTNSDLEGIK
jgi:hypothetical protein